ncbi:hypothetical protein ACLOJK_009917 [Asimina triloba]
MNSFLAKGTGRPQASSYVQLGQRSVCRRKEKRLIDDEKDGSSIFAVVYKFKPPSTPTARNANANAPSYVIAFRGTWFNVKKDIYQDGRIGIRTLHRSSRFELAKKVVSDFAAADGDLDGSSTSVWLAGHSLGASLATLVGKSMAKRGVYLETFLFNPPFPACPISKIRPQRLAEKVRVADSHFKSWLADNAEHSRARKRRKGNKQPLKSDEEEEECLDNLSKWVPHLFLNPRDLVCSEYISYFKHRNTMQEIGAGQTERVASQHCKSAFLMPAWFRGKNSDPFHLLPSANLIINGNQPQGFPEDHALQQWWQPDFQMHPDSKPYLYDDLS